MFGNYKVIINFQFIIHAEFEMNESINTPFMLMMMCASIVPVQIMIVVF